MNELRRTKAKLDLLDNPALLTKQLLLDLLQLCYPSNNPENSVEFFSTQLKGMYIRKIKELEEHSSKFKQTEIEYDS